MKKILFSILLCVISVFVFSQNLDSAYLKFLPSNVSPSEVRPSDIPSQQVLKQMGLSDEEITEAMNFKYQRGVYANTDVDSNSDFSTKIQTFYKKMGDEKLNDSLTFPKAKIYGQDIFRSNRINFFQKATNPNAPENYEIGSGDKLSISVWGNSDYSDVVKVDEKGYVSPLKGDGLGVKLKGKWLDLQNSKIIESKSN